MLYTYRKKAFVFALAVLMVALTCFCAAQANTEARFDMQVLAGELGFKTVSDAGTPGDVFYGTNAEGYTGFYADPALTIGLKKNSEGTALEPFIADGFLFVKYTHITKFSELLAMPTDKGKTSWDYTIWMIGTYNAGSFADWLTGSDNTLAVYPTVRRFNTCTAESQTITGNTSNLVKFNGGSDGTYCFKIDGGAEAKSGTYIIQNDYGDWTYESFVNPAAVVSGSGSSAAAICVGAVNIGDTSITPANITFKNNLQDDYGNTCEALVFECATDGGDGAALYIEDQNTITIEGATIEKCGTIGGNGGAICVEGGGSFVINNGTIVDCKVKNANGAGVAVLTDGSLTLNNTTIESCDVGSRDVSEAGEASWGEYGKGSAIYAQAGSTITATDCTFTNNTGTAIFLDKGSSGNYSQVSITGGEITYNSNYADKGNDLEDAAWGGGAIMAGNGSLSLDGVTIAHNTSYGAPGGAVCVIGAASSVSHSVKNCTVEYNGALSYDGSADTQIDGGALYVYNEGDAHGKIENCTYTGNYASGNGGAIHIISPLDIVDTNFVGNQAAMSGGAIYMEMSSIDNAVTFTGGYSTQNECACATGALTGSAEHATEALSGSALYVAGGTLNYTGHKVYANVSGNQVYAAAIYVEKTATINPDPSTETTTTAAYAKNTKSGEGEAIAAATQTASRHIAGDEYFCAQTTLLSNTPSTAQNYTSPIAETAISQSTFTAQSSLPLWMQYCYGNHRLDGTKADIFIAKNSTLYVSDYSNR